MNRTLLQRELKYSAKILLIFCAILTLYTAMIISMFDPKLGESLEMMKNSMPEIFALVGMDSPGTTLVAFINNYLFGFLYKVFPMIFFVFLISSSGIPSLFKSSVINFTSGSQTFSPSVHW